MNDDGNYDWILTRMISYILHLDFSITIDDEF